MTNSIIPRWLVVSVVCLLLAPSTLAAITADELFEDLDSITEARNNLTKSIDWPHFHPLQVTLYEAGKGDIVTLITGLLDVTSSVNAITKGLSGTHQLNNDDAAEAVNLFIETVDKHTDPYGLFVRLAQKARPFVEARDEAPVFAEIITKIIDALGQYKSAMEKLASALLVVSPPGDYADDLKAVQKVLDDKTAGVGLAIAEFSKEREPLI